MKWVSASLVCWLSGPPQSSELPHSLSLPRPSGTDCRYTFVLSRRLTVLKSRWCLSFSPLTAPNWYVSRHCMISVWQAIALMRALVMTLSCYGALEIVCILLLLWTRTAKKVETSFSSCSGISPLKWERTSHNYMLLLLTISGDYCAMGSTCDHDLRFLLLGSLLLTERCRTDDLLPDLPVPCLPPRRVDSKVLGLNVIVDRSQPGGSWTPHGSPPVRWRS